MPQSKSGDGESEGLPSVSIDELEIKDPDFLKSLSEKQVGSEGMRVDRELWGKAKEEITKDEELKEAVSKEMWQRAETLVIQKYEDKPELYLNLEKIRKAEQLDRRITWKEVLQWAFGVIDKIPNREDLLKEECEKFISIHKPESKHVPYIVNYIRAYITDEEFRQIIDEKDFAELNNYPGFDMIDFKALNGTTDWQKKVPEYIKNYVNLNIFME